MGGLGIPMIGEPTPQFCGGVFLSMSYSNEVVPYLQNVFQADAAHMNFGKYTLFSCYGSTANANTSLIAFAILFGNEDKAGWEAFFDFAKEQHPCLDNSNKTFITDQAKGLVDSVKKVLPAASISTAHTIGGRTSRSTAREARRLILVRGCMISSSVLRLKMRLKGSRQPVPHQ